MQPSTQEESRSSLEQVASIYRITEGPADSQPLSLRPLRYGVGLHLEKSGSTINNVVGLPPALKQGSCYVPAEQPSVGAGESRNYVVKAHVPARLYVLWPAMQEPPAWLYDDFEMVRGAEVKVRWGDLTLKQQFYLNVTNQRLMYEQQVLHVYKFIDNNGITHPGQEVQLPYSPPQQLSSIQPYYSHILCLHPASRSSVSGGGNSMDLQKQAVGARLGLQEIYSGLEDGSFNPKMLTITEADALLHRAMAAVDDELLFMLFEADIAGHCSRPCLQLVLQYAQYEDLPQLAQLILQQSAVELTRPALDWLVNHFVKNGYIREATVLLSSYCRSRRNPLNAVAAVEYSLSKAASSGLVVNEAAVKLAKKFGAAKMALLQQLVERYEGDQSAAADINRSGRLTREFSAGTNMSSLTELGGRGESALQLKPLLRALRQCLQESDAHVLGRSSGSTAVSIHDSSPYTFAVALEDTDFLRVPAVIRYTRKLWAGLELQTIAQAACKAPAAAAGGDSKKRKTGDWGMVAKKGNAHARQRAMARKSKGAAHLHMTTMAGSAGLQIQLPDTPTAANGAASPGVPFTPQSAASWNLPTAADDSGSIRSHSVGSRGFLSRSGTADLDDSGVAESLVWLNPLIGAELLQNMGLGGRLGQPFAQAGMSLLHTLLLTPRALHDAARGRWLKRCFFEAIFLLLYEVFVTGDFRFAVYLLPAFLVGNLASIVLEVRWLHDGSFKDYYRDGWAKLDVFVNSTLLVIFIWELYLYIYGEESAHSNPLEQYGVQLELIVPAAISFMVWTRALGVVVPASERMGALMYTLRRAGEEGMMLLPLVVTLIFGFATNLHVVYAPVSDYYNTFFGALRMAAVFLLGGHHLLLEFSKPEENHGSPFLEIWGQVVVILFGVIVNILIVSLLVAVITKTYNREQVNAKAVLVEAEAVRHYDWRVRHFLAVSPVIIPQMLLSVLPQGHRTRVLPADCLRWLIPPLDGYVPETAMAAPELLLPTGGPEIGYTGFLLFLYPMISVAALLMMIVHLPFGVLHYAMRGHQMWIPSWAASAGKTSADKRNPAAAEAATKVHLQPGGRSSISGSVTGAAAGSASGRRARFLQFVKGEDDSDAGGPASPAARKAPVMQWRSGKVASFNTQPRPRITVHKPNPLRRALGSVLEGLFWVTDTLIEAPIRIGLAAVSGLITHVLLLALIVLVLVWAWFTRLLFSLYCLFWPWAGNAEYQVQITRMANFWDKEGVHDAFASAKLPAGSASEEVQGVDLGSTDMFEGLLARPDQTQNGEATCEVGVQGVRPVSGVMAAPPAVASPGGRGPALPAALEVESFTGENRG